MWLLHTGTLQLTQFTECVPQYAILSHRWTFDEYSFEDLRRNERLDSDGFHKVSACCKRAASEGWSYVWIDTCCIDRTNSVELSEAITSMYDWYSTAGVCYAYLSDVDATLDSTALLAAFMQSNWFTRGWTLQELLAPRKLVFLDNTWDEIGTRNDLRQHIAKVTGINEQHLRGKRLQASIAERMSWASSRTTTRGEDQAYCLMGIFGVRIPLFYGEGTRAAFLRLQYQILQHHDDDSLLAWHSRSDGMYIDSGLLASSPAQFKGCGELKRQFIDKDRTPFVPTSRGLRGRPLLIRVEASSQTGQQQYLMLLNCVNTTFEKQWNTPAQVAILLEKTDRHTFVRVRLLEPIGQLFQEPWDIRNAYRGVIYVEQPQSPERQRSLSSSSMPSLKSVRWETDLLRAQNFSVTVPSTDDSHAVCLVSRSRRDRFLVALESLDSNVGIAVRIHDPNAPRTRTCEPRMGPPMGSDYRNTWRTFQTLSTGAWLTVTLTKSTRFHVVEYTVKLTYSPPQAHFQHSLALVPVAAQQETSMQLALRAPGDSDDDRVAPRPRVRLKNTRDRKFKARTSLRIAIAATSLLVGFVVF